MNVKHTVNRYLRQLQVLHVPVARPSIIRVFDHDPEAFTQGLVYSEGELYESTGSWQRSSLRRLCPASGAILEMVRVEDNFAEGIARVNEHIYQLTWTSGKVLIYATNPIRLVSEGQIHQHGWGLAAYDGGLLTTDGSHRIRRYNPDLRITGSFAVRRLGLPFRHLNALTTVSDQAFVNIWCTSLIAQLDLPSGRLVRVIDCSELEAIESPKTPHHILNGICYRPESGSFFVTGKNWHRMFEMRMASVEK